MLQIKIYGFNSFKLHDYEAISVMSQDSPFLNSYVMSIFLCSDQYKLEKRRLTFIWKLNNSFFEISLFRGNYSWKELSWFTRLETFLSPLRKFTKSCPAGVVQLMPSRCLLPELVTPAVLMSFYVTYFVISDDKLSSTRYSLHSVIVQFVTFKT